MADPARRLATCDVARTPPFEAIELDVGRLFPPAEDPPPPPAAGDAPAGT